MSLIHAGLGIAVLLAYLEELPYFRGSIVGESELLELSLIQSVIHCPCRILEGCLAIGYMQKHGLHSGSLKGIKRLHDAHLNLRRCMIPGMAIEDF